MLFVSVNVKNSLSLTDRNWCWPKRVWTRRIENATTKQLLAIEHKIDFSVRCWTDFVHSFVERSLSLVPSAWTHRTRHRVGALCCSSVIVIGMRRTETVWIGQNSCFICFFLCDLFALISSVLRSIQLNHNEIRSPKIEKELWKSSQIEFIYDLFVNSHCQWTQTT